MCNQLSSKPAAPFLAVFGMALCWAPVHLTYATEGTPAQRQPASWHGNVALEVYDVDVEVPAGGSGSSPLRPGIFTKATTTGDLRLPMLEGATHLQYSLTSTDDQAVLSRFYAQTSTLQAGYTASDRQLLAGDFATASSRLAPGGGLRGLSGTYAGGRLSVSAYGGSASESWETLWGAPTRDPYPARLAYRRDALGGAASVNVGGGLQAFATHQSWSERGGSVTADIASQLPLPVSGNVATGGVNWATQIDAGTQMRAGLEYGQSRVHDETASLEDSAYSLEVGGSTNVGAAKLSLRAGRNSAGQGWRVPVASIAPGLSENFVAADFQWAPAVTVSHEYRSGVVESDLAPEDFHQESRSWRVTLAPAALPGWSTTLLHTRQQSGYESQQGVSDQATFSVDYAAGAWGVSAASTRQHATYAANPQAEARAREARVTVRNTTALDGTNVAGVTSLQWSLAGGRLVQKTQYPSELATDFVVASAVASSTAAGALSATLEFKSIHDAVAERRYRSCAYSIQWQRDWANGLGLRAYLRRSSTLKGLASAEVTERVGGFALTYQW